MNDKDCFDKIHKEVEQELRDYKGPHCCMTMHYELLSEEAILIYNAQLCEYGIKLYESKNYLVMKCCMVCGTKLPDSLRGKWLEVLRQEYSIIDPIGKDKKLIPKKFLSHEWWNPNGTFSSYQGKKIIKNVKTEELNHQTTHCCEAIDYELLNKVSILKYSSKYREYNVKIFNSNVCAAMDFCIFCGKKLPDSLGKEWLNILEQEYGLEWPDSKDKKKVPKEFLTDEWWKKRGL